VDCDVTPLLTTGCDRVEMDPGSHRKVAMVVRRPSMPTGLKMVPGMGGYVTIRVTKGVIADSLFR